jgi:hypothetical protein
LIRTIFQFLSSLKISLNLRKLQSLNIILSFFFPSLKSDMGPKLLNYFWHVHTVKGEEQIWNSDLRFMRCDSQLVELSLNDGSVKLYINKWSSLVLNLIQTKLIFRLLYLNIWIYLVFFFFKLLKTSRKGEGGHSF